MSSFPIILPSQSVYGSRARLAFTGTLAGKEPGLSTDTGSRMIILRPTAPMIAGAIFIATMMLLACSRALRKFVLFLILAGLFAVAVLARF